MKKNIKIILIGVIIIALIALSIPPKKQSEPKHTIVRAQLIASDEGHRVPPADYYSQGGAKLIDPKTGTEYGVFLCLPEWRPLVVGSYYDIDLDELHRARTSHSAETSGCYFNPLTLSAQQ